MNLPIIYCYITYVLLINVGRTDIIYCRYLDYCLTHQRQLKTFTELIQQQLSTQAGRDSILNIAIIRHEDPNDVTKDIDELHTQTEFKFLKIHLSALIYSQLFQVPNIGKKPQLFTLNEFSKLSKHHQSFVCYQDIGNIS